MKILVNGRNGTIGKYISNICSSLSGDLSTGEQVKNFSNLTDNETIFVHLAGVVGNALVERDLARSYKVNVQATKELGEESLTKGIRKFIYISSSHVYGNSNQKITENHPTNPQSSYADQKLEGEQVLLDIFSTQLEKLLIIRVFSILDFGMPEFTLGGAIENIIANPENSRVNNANDVRDFLSPKTVAKNLEIIATREISGIYNLCSGKGETIANAALKMASKKGVSLPSTAFIHNELTKTSIVGDNSKIVQAIDGLDLNWSLS